MKIGSKQDQARPLDQLVQTTVRSLSAFRQVLKFEGVDPTIEVSYSGRGDTPAARVVIRQLIINLVKAREIGEPQYRSTLMDCLATLAQILEHRHRRRLDRPGFKPSTAPIPRKVELGGARWRYFRSRIERIFDQNSVHPRSDDVI